MAEEYVHVLDADKRTPEMKTWARTNDKKIHKLLMKRVTTIPANNQCADCTAKRPGWAALPHGIHICINCAQIHRRIGRHISQVKAINTGTYLWHRDEYNCMVAMGNEAAARLYLSGGGSSSSSNHKRAPPKPKATDSVEKKEAYIRDVYEHKKYLNPSFQLNHPAKSKPSGKKAPAAPAAADTHAHDTPQLLFLQASTSKPTMTSQTIQPGSATLVRKQPASYDFFSNSSAAPSQSTEVDFFSIFDMKATAPAAMAAASSATASSHAKPNTEAVTDQDFADILSLYRD
eukprot:INCI16637.1.p1 GENE.INCI16637.1~~INCI16637.1.p1  ORF type:complete len:324 (+),score=63.75 INCI16637.1:108-974(+)